MTCKFCQIGVGIHPSELDRPIYEDADYYAVASIGGFVPGWTLVFPKRHIFNLSDDYQKPAFQECLRTVTSLVSSEFGRCVHFEHGAAWQNSQTGCGVNHAHIHIVPFSKDLESLSATARADLEWQKVSVSGIQAVSRRSEYLFCSDAFVSSDSTGLLAPLYSPESQFFRRLIAKSQGLHTLYDYKQHRFDELSSDTASRLRHRLSAIATPVL